MCPLRQFNRHIFQILSSHGKYLTQRVFRFPSGSNLSSYTQLYTAFLISGLIHNPGRDTRPLQFFLFQAVAITFEDATIALAARIGLKTMHRSIGYFWVYCWFVFSLPSWVDSLKSAGVRSEFSLTLGLYPKGRTRSLVSG